MRQRNPWTRTTIGALALVVGLAAEAPLAFAVEVPKAPQQRSLAAAAAAAAATIAPATTKHAAAIAPTQEPAAAVGGESKSFFKTGRGIAALVLMVGASAWVIASRKSSDVVHSPGRQ